MLPLPFDDCRKIKDSLNKLSVSMHPWTLLFINFAAFSSIYVSFNLVQDRRRRQRSLRYSSGANARARAADRGGNVKVREGIGHPHGGSHRWVVAGRARVQTADGMRGEAPGNVFVCTAC